MRNHSTLCSVKEFITTRKTDNLFADYCHSRRKLWFVFEKFDQIPSRACCYVIYLDGVLSYIGSTENLKARLWKHFWVNPQWKISNWSIKVKFPRYFGEWAMTELRLIRRLKPLFNKQGVKTKEVFE